MIFRSYRDCGFSYVELMVCTAIVLTLYAVYLGPSSRMGQEKRKADCAHRLEQLHLALALYAQEHGGVFPVTSGAHSSEQPLSVLVPQYTSDTSVFICPAGRQSELPAAQPFEDRRISYAYYMGVRSDAAPTMPLISDAQVSASATKHSGELIFDEHRSSTGGNHGPYGGNILFTDGHVESFANRVSQDLGVPSGVSLLNPKP
jgi:prepilin-type processing-associated H-X9-DG protein